MLLGQVADLLFELHLRNVESAFPLDGLQDDKSHLFRIDESDIRGEEMPQPAQPSILAGSADHPAAGAVIRRAGAEGKIGDVRNLGKPVTLDLLAAVEGKGSRGSARERPRRNRSHSRNFFMIVADLNAVIHRLGPGIEEKSRTESELT